MTWERTRRVGARCREMGQRTYNDPIRAARINRRNDWRGYPDGERKPMGPVPPPFLPDDQRTMPWTRGDSEILSHRALCKCQICKVPMARKVAVLVRRARLRAPSPLSQEQQYLLALRPLVGEEE